MKISIIYHLCAAKLKHNWKQKTIDAFTHFIHKFAVCCMNLSFHYWLKISG